jgi:cell division protein FtsZ
MAAAPAPEPAPHVEPSLNLDESFIPPMPERAIVRPTRMPRVEDLPAPGQAQLNAHRGAQAAPQPPSAIEQKRMSLMQRLASVGFGRREEEMAEQQVPVRQAQPPVAPPLPQAPAPSAAHAEYMRRPVQQPAARPAQGALDPHGRAQPARASEEDHLEIPAFLRRQAN